MSNEHFFYRLYSCHYHLSDQLAEDVRRFQTLSISYESRYKYVSVYMKQAYKSSWPGR